MVLRKTNYFRLVHGELKLVPGFAEFLLQLDSAALPSAVATSGSRSRVEQTLEILNLCKRFRAVVTGNDVERGKPDPALFLLAAQSLQVDASQILVCEDAVAGVLAAKSCGNEVCGHCCERQGILVKASWR